MSHLYMDITLISPLCSHFAVLKWQMQMIDSHTVILSLWLLMCNNSLVYFDGYFVMHKRARPSMVRCKTRMRNGDWYDGRTDLFYQFWWSCLEKQQNVLKVQLPRFKPENDPDDWESSSTILVFIYLRFCFMYRWADTEFFIISSHNKCIWLTWNGT